MGNYLNKSNLEDDLKKAIWKMTSEFWLVSKYGSLGKHKTWKIKVLILNKHNMRNELNKSIMGDDFKN